MERHNEELHNLHTLRVITVFRSRTVKWVWTVARLG